MIAAGRHPRRLASRLHRGEQQARERSDDRDHHQEFNEGEGAVNRLDSF